MGRAILARFQSLPGQRHQKHDQVDPFATHTSGPKERHIEGPELIIVKRSLLALALSSSPYWVGIWLSLLNASSPYWMVNSLINRLEIWLTIY